jgi:hypothetical protein
MRLLVALAVPHGAKAMVGAKRATERIAERESCMMNIGRITRMKKYGTNVKACLMTSSFCGCDGSEYPRIVGLVLS